MAANKKMAPAMSERLIKKSMLRIINVAIIMGINTITYMVTGAKLEKRK